jgi:hypothetical protein
VKGVEVSNLSVDFLKKCLKKENRPMAAALKKHNWLNAIECTVQRKINTKHTLEEDNVF